MSFIVLHCEVSSIYHFLPLSILLSVVYRENGAHGNGDPGIREEMSRYPYYAAFAIDMEGNNVEAVSAPREARNRNA